MKFVTENDKKFSNIPNQYNLIFNRFSTIIEDVTPDNNTIDKYQFNFVKNIKAIESKQVGYQIDVIGIVTSVGEIVETVDVKNTNNVNEQKYHIHRDLTLIDHTGCEIKCTLWDTQATFYELGNVPFIAAFHHVNVSDYHGRSLNALSFSTLVLNPNVPEITIIQEYLSSILSTNNNGGTFPVTYSLSNAIEGSARYSDFLLHKRTTIDAITLHNLGTNPTKADIIVLKGTVTYIKQTDCCYNSCTTFNCNKKVTIKPDDNSGIYFCTSCLKSIDQPQQRYILNAQISDHTGTTWVTMFDETAQYFLGVSATHMTHLKNTEQSNAIQNIFTNALFKTFIYKVTFINCLYFSKYHNIVFSFVSHPRPPTMNDA